MHFPRSPQILSGRTEKRQIGAKAGNSFSVARFVTEEDTPDAGAPLDIPFNKIGKKWRAENDRAFWSEMMPEAVEEHDARVSHLLRFVTRSHNNFHTGHPRHPYTLWRNQSC